MAQGGNVERVGDEVATSTDVTRWSTAEERLDFVQRASASGLFEWDVRADNIVWSAELEALYGLPAGGFQGRYENWLAHVHPDDRKHVEADLQAALAGKDPYDVEYRIVWPDGTLRWIWGQADVTRDEDGNVLRVLGVNIDITARKTYEENLRFLARASALLSASLDIDTIWRSLTELAIPHIADWCAVDVLNEQGIFDIAAIAHRDPEKVRLVRAYREAHPIDMNGAHGLPQIVKTLQPEHIPMITDALLAAVARDEDDLAIIRDLGMSSALSVPLVVRGQGVGAITFVTSDSRRRLDAPEVAMATELATRASLALENATLYAEARAAVRVRDDFISVASHELKTPITSLKMYTQMLHRQLVRAGEERQASFLAKIDAQANKLIRLVNDLLDVTRLQHGRLAYRDTLFDLNTVVREASEEAEPATEGHVIHIEGSIQRQLYGDRDRIGQVLLNLLTNAIKFSPTTEPVTVEVTEEGDWARVTVRDHGIGIDEEHQAHIFDQFYRVEDTHDQNYPGLGIGLYITHEIVTRHGGTISVTSAKGSGSTFTVALPFAREGDESPHDDRARVMANDTVETTQP